jgi:hypothetical protein
LWRILLIHNPLRKTIKIFGCLSFVWVSLFSFSVFSQETSGDFSGGSIKVGGESRVCAPSLEGVIRYNSTINKIQFCNGSAWVNWGE